MLSSFGLHLGATSASRPNSNLFLVSPLTSSLVVHSSPGPGWTLAHSLCYWSTSTSPYLVPGRVFSLAVKTSVSRSGVAASWLQVLLIQMMGSGNNGSRHWVPATHAADLDWSPSLRFQSYSISGCHGHLEGESWMLKSSLPLPLAP